MLLRKKGKNSDKIINQAIRDRTEVEDDVEVILNLKWNWVGHIVKATRKSYNGDEGMTPIVNKLKT